MGVVPGDVAKFAIGTKTPGRVAVPASLEAFADELRGCAERGEAACIWGGGTLQSLGFSPERYDVALCTAALANIIAYEHRDLTIAVEAGLGVDALLAVLAEHRQFVPLDAPLGNRSTIGGLLAAGWSGPRRAAYGRPRDFLIGSTIALVDGTLAKSGGMVVKNSTGYDLGKLWCGSLGTLGAIVRANFKTLPLPEAQRIALAPIPEGALRRTLDHVTALAIEPTAVVVLSGFLEAGGRDGAEGRILVMHEGSRVVVDRATRELRSALGAAGVPETALSEGDAVAPAFRRLLDAYVAHLGERSATLRFAGLPGDAPVRCERLTALATARGLAADTLLDALGGDVYVRVSTRSTAGFGAKFLEFASALAAALPGVSVFNAPDAVRDEVAMWGAPPPALDLMRSLKARFDPKSTLAPGRFAGRI